MAKNLVYESAIASHLGMVRLTNQDSGFAGERLYLVADGMGGHAGGDVASAMVAKHMAGLDEGLYTDPAQATETLKGALLEANQLLRDEVVTTPKLAGLGTTFTGFIPVGETLAVAHIGDSRLYLFRGGNLTQCTVDHTFVQKLVDSGRITEEEAKVHPRRSVLMRVLGDVESSPDVDVVLLDTRPGDVWLLCSDGLCGYVDNHDIEKVLRRRESLQQAVDSLIDKSLVRGAPDNVTCVLVEAVADERAERAFSGGVSASGQDVRVADVRQPGVEKKPGAGGAGGGAVTGQVRLTVKPVSKRRFVGSAAQSPILRTGVISTARNKIMGRRTVRKPPRVEESHFEPRANEYLNELIAETRRLNRRRRLLWFFGAVAVGLGVALALFFAYNWTQSRYFVGSDEDSVVIYRGVQQELGGFKLYSVAEDTNIGLQELDGLERRQVQRTLPAASLREARDIVVRLVELYE